MKTTNLLLNLNHTFDNCIPTFGPPCIYSSITRKIFYQKSKSGCRLYTRAGLANKMVFHNQMCHFLSYALALELRKSKTKFYINFKWKINVCIIHE